MVVDRRKILLGIANMGGLWPTRALGMFNTGSLIHPASLSTTLAADKQQSCVDAEANNKHTSAPPRFDEYASVEALSQGESVYGFDYMMYIYGVGPDLMPGITLQEANANPLVKIKPKKSWEIRHNLLGSNTSQVPRTRNNDSHPTLPIHLIDGDPDTVWCSFGSLMPDVHPEWIRIDLPIEATVVSVKLACTNSFYPNSNFGRALPKELTVKLSVDAWHWETVYASNSVNVEAGQGVEIRFAPRRAKQIWITGNNFLTRINTPSSAGSVAFFSIAGVEVRDPRGENLALVSRGAGVTVSSTYFGHADNGLTQAALWAPLHYEAGMTWLRIAGGEAGAYDWQYTEQKRGRYQFDSVLDTWLTDLHRSGVKLMWGLDLYGNPIYQNPPQDTDWSEVRIRKFTDGTLWTVVDVDSSPEMFEAYLRYVEFTVRHLKGRVFIYEVGNEFTGCGWDDQIAERYMKIFQKTYEVVKRADPDARIMPASPDLFAPDFLLTLLGQPRKAGVNNGKLLANGGRWISLESSTLLLAEEVRVKNAEINVAALNRGRFGIVLCYQSPERFVVAGYGTCWPGAGRYALVIAERIGSSWQTSRMSSKNLDADLSQNLQLKVTSKADKITLQVSDGNRIESLTHELSGNAFDGDGAVGLLQLTGAQQAFSAFSVHDSYGADLFRQEFHGMEGSDPTGWAYIYGPQTKNPIPPGWASKIDAIGWHPYNPPDGAYFDAVRDLKRQSAELGFRGDYYATELYNFFTYPPTPTAPLSELQHGIVSAISAVGHSGLDTLANTQILHFTGHATADSNCRIAWPTEVATPVQPSVMYYIWRTLATVLDDFHAAEFPVKLEGSNRDAMVFSFRRGEDEYLVAAWLSYPSSTRPNEIQEELYDITVMGMRVHRGWLIDLMNGTEQQAILQRKDQNTVVRGVRVKNYPTLLRFTQDNG
jgi:hypothetical protein